MLLTLSPLPAGVLLNAQLATAKGLATADALLLPPDSLPVAHLEGQALRWKQLALIQRARAVGLPLLAWGNGAALLGRSVGGKVERATLRGVWEWQGLPLWIETPAHYSGELCTQAAQMRVMAYLDGQPALWQLEQAIALIDPQPSEAQLGQLLTLLPAPLRLPSSVLEGIGGPEALRALLHDFYAHCRADALLAPTFALVSDWPAHMEQVQRFWETMLGGAGPQPWRGNLNHIHAPLGVRSAQLERWLELFGASAERHLDAPAAALIVSRAQAMGARLGRRGEG